MTTNSQVGADHPYPGLRPFYPYEGDVFFGREEDIDQLIEKLEKSHFIAVVGYSGCGKSSLVHVGLVKDLETGFHYGHAWQVAELRPGNSPFANLAEALLKHTALRGVNLRERLHSQPDSLHKILQEMPLPTENTNLLILVDQFEELFRFQQEGGKEEVAKFVTWLLKSQEHSKVYIVITMRSEFLEHCKNFYELTQAINQGFFLVPPLKPKQLQEAIESPARVFSSKIEPTLVESLLEDIGDNSDQLPLIQHVLMSMWPHEVDKDSGKTFTLTLEEYKKRGKATTALSKTAEEIYQSLDNKQQNITEVLFRNLTERLGKRDKEEPTYVRRSVKLDEVAKLAGVDYLAVVDIVEQFRGLRRHFLTPPRDVRLVPDRVIDISHEALIRQWKRLSTWAEKEADSADYYRRLEDVARRWDNKQAALWTHPDLGIALTWRKKLQTHLYKTDDRLKRWAGRYGRDFDLAMRFLKASEEQQKVENTRKRDSQRQHHLLVGVSWGIILTVGVAGWGIWERHQALSTKNQIEQLEKTRTTDLFDSQRTHAAALIAQQEDYASAKQLLTKTFGLDPDVDASQRYARNLLARFNDLMGGTPQQDYKGAKAALYATAISPDGLTLAVAGENGTVVLFDAKTGQLVQRLQGHTDQVRTVLFHPHGKWLATAGDDKQIIRWSFPKGEKLKEWTAPDKVLALAISPDGTRLASGGEDKNISVWEAETGQVLNTFKGHEGEIAGLAFNNPTAGGELLLASASFDKTARLWQVNNTGQSPPVVLQGHTDKVQTLTFSPDGRFLATSSNDKTIRLWNVNSDQTERVFSGHKNTIYGLTFTPDGRYLLSSSADNTLRIWETGSGVTVRILQGHTATVTGVTLHGQQLFSASNDGTAKRWDTTLPYQVSLDLPSEPASTAIAPDGSRVAVGFADGTLRLYPLPVGEGKPVWEQPKVHQRDIQRLAFSADSTLLASASLDTTVKLWQVKEGQLLQTLSGHKQGVSAAAFSPTRTTLVTVSYDGQLGVFKVGSPALQFYPAYEGPPEEINAVTFDATGNQLLTTSDHTTRLWHFDNDIPKLWQTYPKTDEDLLWATLSPDGQRYVTGGRKFVAQVYATTNSQLQYSLVGHEESILRAAFSPDNQQLATISGDATVRFWDLTNGSELFTLRLPTNSGKPEPLWDFDWRCTPTGCWLAVPLTRGKLMVYELGKIYP